MDQQHPGFNKFRRLSGTSKLARLAQRPFRYLYSILFRELFYPFTKKEVLKKARLFFGREMQVALPSATDIYLTGGKSHDSEVRLALFLMNTLKRGQSFLDIGAHYGYFSLLASELTGIKGRVFSFEPSSKTFELLRQNVSGFTNITVFQKAVSADDEDVVFYEFDNLHSEYNSIFVGQFEKKDWFQKSPPKETRIPATSIDKLTSTFNFLPDLIKIDVEGAEYQVISGALRYLDARTPLLILEYLEPSRSNDQHRQATRLLEAHHYFPNAIDDQGNLQRLEDIDSYLIEKSLDSDNIVFRKDQ